MSKVMNIIYDGDCAFCVRSLKMVRALDVGKVMRFHDSHQRETSERFPELRDANVDEAMYIVVEGETPQRGFFAFRRLLWSSFLMWPLIPILYFPGASFLGPRVYGWVAHHRQYFGCGSDFCSLPAEGPRANVQHEE